MRERDSTARERVRPSLDAAALERLAVAYVGRYATTRKRLADYLRRKLGERGWAGDGPPPVEAVVAKAAALGYVDDRAFATARGASLGRRGYGAARVAASLRAAGIGEQDGAAALAAARDGEQALAAALAYARRRRIGPFAHARADRPARERALASLLRAGHDLALARRIVSAAPGEDLDATGR